MTLYWLGRLVADMENYSGPQLDLRAFRGFIDGSHVRAKFTERAMSIGLRNCVVKWLPHCRGGLHSLDVLSTYTTINGVEMLSLNSTLFPTLTHPHSTLVTKRATAVL